MDLSIIVSSGEVILTGIGAVEVLHFIMRSKTISTISLIIINHIK